ncbi:MAG: class I SAM-dependent methyltransferase [Ferruginibacter sp.]|nr:class I SAM-dependent methyltransferase [Cytophagales bacterium]
MAAPLYNQIGIGYNQTRRADPYLVRQLRRLLAPAKARRYLDVGCGTGNYTYALASRDCAFTGVDPSQRMLDQAQTLPEDKAVGWLLGSAEALPAEDNFFSGAVATLTIHHWPSLDRGFREVSRVMEPGSPFVIFTALPAQMSGYWLNAYFPRLLAAAAGQMPDFAGIETALNGAGFQSVASEKYFVQPDLADLFLYAGKHQPTRYLDENVRSGISSFAALANQAEVENGLARLAHDIQTKAIEKAMRQYENDLGDYLFVRAILEK